MSLRLLLLCLSLVGALRAAGPDEKLAGEDDKAVPTAVPTPMGDERGPVSATRSAQAAPSFDLPAFVVTGSGERQALARRQDLGAGRLDTSGGLKTSPGEEGAGKDQLEAGASRESLEAQDAPSKPFVAGLRLGGGWQPGYDASGYAAQELGPWFWSLDGDAAYSEGGPKRPPMTDKALSDMGGLRGRAGWRDADGSSLALFAEGAFASRAPQPYIAGQTEALKRGRALGGLEGETRFAGFGLRSRAEGGAYSGRFAGLDLYEEQAGLSLDLSRKLSGYTGSALLDAAFSTDSSSMAWAGQRRSRTLLRGALSSRFDMFKGTRLGLGLAADLALGDDSAFVLGPQLRWDQHLAPGWSFNAELLSGLRLSRLKGSSEPWHAPDPGLKPARLNADAKLDLNWSAKPGLLLSVGAFSQSGEDWHLPSMAPGTVLAVDSAVRGFRLMGLRAGARWEDGPWSSRLEAALQHAQLPDLAGWASFTPAFTAHWDGAWAQGPWKATLGLDLLGARHAALDGSLPQEPSAALSAGLSYAINEAWSVYGEGRNLAAQTLEPAPYYPQAAPYVGLGLELRF